MIRYLLLVIISLSLLISSCKKKEDGEEETYKINYMNQTMYGKMGGQTWIFKTGNAYTSFINPPDNNQVFEFRDSFTADSCFLEKGRTVFFYFTDKNPHITNTSKTLSFDINNVVNYTVSFHYMIDSNSHTTVASNGGYEILSVDTANEIIKGRIDAYADKNNYVNGNFEIKLCYH